MRGKFTVTIIASILILGSFTPILLVKDVFASTEVAKITASDAAAGDFFGISSSISGDRAIVGANFDDDAGSASGSAYIFERDSGGNWVEVDKLTASDAAGGDEFGWSVSISGDKAIVGAYRDDDAGSASGSAYIFERDSGGNWVEVDKLTASDAAFFNFFGWSVSISGDRAIVGAHRNDDTGSDSGSAYIFELNNPPICTNTVPSENSLWPPNHKMKEINIEGIADSDGDTVNVTISGITQDEPVNDQGDGDTSPDGDGVGTNTVKLRAERSGNGDGRVYEISFTADDGNGGTCTGMVQVGVPHDKKGTAVNSGQIYDSTES